MSFFDPVLGYSAPLARGWRMTAPIASLVPQRVPVIAPDTPFLTSPFMWLSSMITNEVMLPVPELEPVMPYYDVLWNYEDEDGNVAHIAEHGLTPEDIN
jgi:hypothetical protein